MSRRDLYAIGAGIAMLAGGVAGCSPGHGAEPDSSAPPSVVASQVATPDASAAPTTVAASNIKDGQTSDGRAYASLKPGDTLASADYVGALRAGIKMYRFGDGSAAVVDPSGTPPDAVIADVASGLGDGLDMMSSRENDVVGNLRNSGVRAFIVRPIYTELVQDGWLLSDANVDGFVRDSVGTTARPTVEEAIAARQADIDAHPDVVILGPDGIIPRG